MNSLAIPESHRLLPEAAQQLLRPEDPIKRIAPNWGFSDNGHFGQ